MRSTVARGIAALVERLTKLALARVVLEASGGLENALVAELVAAGLPAVVVNPRQVCDFARAPGQLAKTDPLDARVRARFGERMRPELRDLPDEQERALKALVVQRRQLVEMMGGFIYVDCGYGRQSRENVASQRRQN